MKLKIPPIGVNPNNYKIQSGKKHKKPKSWAGNFAVVVPAIASSGEGGTLRDQRKVALRFFLAKTPSHITQITSFINNNPHPSLVDCKMYRNMLTLKNGEKADMMEMDFVEGPTLDDWVEQTILSGSKDKLVEMAEGIRTVVNQLVNIGFYHGDLSHSNIMIDESNTGQLLVDKIRLIDYDSVLVKGISNPPETKEVGHPNFQHPSRKSSRFTILEDVFFTSLVIYVSLIAISENPNLWQAGTENRNFHSKGDNLLFQSPRGDLERTDTDLWVELDKIHYPGETKKALDCLKKAVNTSKLEGSDFLSQVEEWFSIGTLNVHPIPVVHRKINKGNRTSKQSSSNNNLSIPSPKPRKKVSKPMPSPKPRKKLSKPMPSPKPRKKDTKPKLKKTLLEQVIPAETKRKPANKSSSASRPKIRQEILDQQATKEAAKEAAKEAKKAKKAKKASKEAKKAPKEANKKNTQKIRKKKLKTIPVQFEKLSGMKIVIDGANALHECSSDMKSLDLLPLQNLISLFEAASTESVSIIFDASTRYKFSDENFLQFQKLIDSNKENYTVAPKATEADSIILNVAYQTQSLVVSNDFFVDYKKQIPEAHDWFSKNHITMSYVAGIWTINALHDNQFLEK